MAAPKDPRPLTIAQRRSALYLRRAYPHASPEQLRTAMTGVKASVAQLERWLEEIGYRQGMSLTELYDLKDPVIEQAQRDRFAGLQEAMRLHSESDADTPDPFADLVGDDEDLNPFPL